MSAFDPIDGWFEKGFRIRQQAASKPAREKIRSRAGGGISSTSGVKFSSKARTSNAKSVARKAPEVMVKITGKSDGLTSVKRHIDYISRNGEVELTNENGESIIGKSAIKDLRENYKASQIPETSNKREFLHVIFSMPAGTPKKEMEDAVLRFCKEEFSNRRYVAAYHDDTDHAHMHVCVNTRDIDRHDAPRLSPRKDDLARWRQGFADKLRENGIEAAASDRRHRFNFQRPEHAAIRQIRADNPESAVFNERRAKEKALSKSIKAMESPKTAFVGAPRPPRVPDITAKQIKQIRDALATGQRPVNPHADAIEASKSETLKAWRQVARNLVQDGDAATAKSVKEIIKQGEQPVSSQAQKIFDLATKNQQKNIDKSSSQER